RALEDVAEHPVFHAHAVRLEDARLGAVEDLYEAELALGRHAESVGELDALVAEYPFRERLRAQQMVALYRSGRQAEALAGYQDARRVLVEELGIDPSPALRELEQAILTHEPTLAGAAARPVTRRLTMPAPLRVSQDVRFLGRRTELDLLGNAWRRAAAGERQVVVVAGEPGIGKTRLVNEAALAAHSHGGRVLYGRCHPELGVPYQPFIDALGLYIGGCGDEELAAHLRDCGGELARMVPGLAGRVPQLPRPPAADAETDRYQLFQAVSNLLARASEAAPVVLVLEDLHWATKPTVLLFRHLVTSVEPMALLLVATHRHTDLSPTHPLREVLADLGRQQGLERIILGGLDEADVASLVKHTAGHRLEGGVAALANALWRETDGNPFFVTEIVRHLEESLAIAGGDDPFLGTPDLEKVGIPDSVRGVIRRRLERLSPDVNRALPVAAVIGMEFDLDVTSRATGLTEHEMLDVVEEAMAAALVTEVPGRVGRFSFAHALIRHSLYDALGPTRRAQLHREVAEALEALWPQPDAQLPSLAHHWFSAGPTGDTAKALMYARQAGDKALSELAYEEAADHFQRSLTMLETGGREQSPLRCDVLLALGDAQRRAGDTRFRLTMFEAARLSRELGDGERFARAALGSSRTAAWFGEIGRVDQAVVDLHEEALAALGPGDSVLRANVQSQMAVEQYWTPARDRRRALCENATAMVRRLDDRAGLAQVLVARIVATWDPTTLDERLVLLEELLQLAAELDNRELIFRGRLYLAICLFEAADVDRAHEELATATRLAGDLRQPIWNWLTRTAETMQLLLTGSADAEEGIFAAFELGQRSRQPDAPLLMAVQLCVAWWDLGRLGDAINFLRPYVDELPAIPTFRAGLAFAYCEDGRLEEGREQFEVLASGGFDLPLDWTWSTGMTLLAETCAILADEERAEVLYDRILPFARRLVVVGIGQFCLGSAWRSLAILAAAMRRWDDAERHFEEALAVNEHIGARTFVVRAQRAYAAMLLDRNRTGDAERAGELVQQGLRTTRELKMRLERERLHELAGYASCSNFRESTRLAQGRRQA
ncbi:MAG: AAA family ATPase, partial [Actinomycetota bacterium]|nr:AAA family ATPase [Actinomycetota bacterium]